jgi:hypothetical protein
MKSKVIIGAIWGLIAIATASPVLLHETPLPSVPQSKRCAVMAHRRDVGAIPISLGATKDQIRRVLGDPQNSDVSGEVWLWLFDWDSYERQRLAHDWLTMSRNAGHGRARTPLWSHYRQQHHQRANNDDGKIDQPN